MPMSNPWDNPAFNMSSLTRAVNLLPNNYGRVRERNIFPGRGVRTRTIIVEEKQGILTLLPTLPVGSPGTVAQTEKRKVRSFVIPHVPHDDLVMPADVQDLRGFGEESALQVFAELVNDRLQTMRNKHAITLEHLRCGALNGLILDADGSTIYDLFAEFEITGVTSWTDPAINVGKRLSLDFTLGTVGTNILARVNDVARHIEANLQGEQMSGIHVFASSEFFDAFTSHARVEEAYARWQDGVALRSDMRAGFPFGKLLIEEYIGVASDAAGNVRNLIPAGEAIAFPSGTVETFATYYAPADFNETVNTMGMELYARQEDREFGRGRKLHTQSNPLPLVHRPSTLVRMHTSD